MDQYRAAGLSTTEAKCYEALLKMPEVKPSELATIVNETRTNCYKILHKLQELGLAECADVGKTLHFRATNPTHLLQLARERRTAQEKAEQALETRVQELTRQYIQTHEQPYVQHYVGRDELKEIYQEQVRAKAPICFMNATAGIDFYGFEQMDAIRKQMIKAGIARWGLVPDNKWAPPDVAQQDRKNLLHRTWLHEDDYTAPVEWGVYGDTLYIVSFGTEAVGITIKSAQVADAFRQVFALIQRGQRLLPDYKDLPKLNHNVDAAEEG